MESDTINSDIRRLAMDWLRGQLPSRTLTYADYLSTIVGLNLVTGDSVRTSQIMTAVIDQAKRHGYSSDWVQTEVRFEAQAEAIGNRGSWLVLQLRNSTGKDQDLDLYNLRASRFTQNE
jgi:hypothetical protein